MKGNVKEIDYKSAVDFLLPRHYAGCIPVLIMTSISKLWSKDGW